MPAETALTRLCEPYAIEPEDLGGLTRAARTLHLGPHQALQGEPARGCELLLVERGELRMAMRSADGHELLLALARRDDSLGPISWEADGLRDRQIYAHRDGAVVYGLCQDRLDALLPRYPALGLAISERSRAVLGEITDRLVEMAFLPLEDRLCALLARWAQRSGSDLVDLMQEDLAALLGSSRERVGKALCALQRLGLVAIMPRRGVRLLDPHGLAVRAAWGESGREVPQRGNIELAPAV